MGRRGKHGRTLLLAVSTWLRERGKREVGREGGREGEGGREVGKNGGRKGEREGGRRGEHDKRLQQNKCICMMYVYTK